VVEEEDLQTKRSWAYLNLNLKYWKEVGEKKNKK
jgi:hypothetical protein